MSHEVEGGEACVISTLGVANGTDYRGIKVLYGQAGKDKYWKLRLIEAGFEGWGDWMEAYNMNIIMRDGLTKSEINQYYKIGERIYQSTIGQ